MKYIAFLPLLYLILSCQDTSSPAASEAEPTTRTVPKAGTLVLADSMKIKDDINKDHFGVKLVAGEHTFRGTYTIRANYGFDTAVSEITFPKSEFEIKPAIKKGNEPLSYVIGFYHADDETFYDYFLVEGKKQGKVGQIKMKYLKGYSFK